MGTMDATANEKDRQAAPLPRRCESLRKQSWALYATGSSQFRSSTARTGGVGSVAMAGVRLINGVSACDDVSMPTPGTPLPAALIPDCAKPEAHHAAYRSAKTNDAIFVCIARQGSRWKVELDAMASSGPTIPDQAVAVLQSAVEVLVSAGTVTQANIAADYISIRAIESEQKAREIAAAFHAAMHGLRQLYIAVPVPRRRA
ncbi:hypothetical protein ACFXKC_01905 [Streptomyces sp. NPDC059340]|uniref:hypothetical protein n=1 Tax=Streptomyces sp. NPDC059340 TaxID=3346806 RepID=UPI0036C64401